jgi:hypothetical protein
MRFAPQMTLPSTRKLDSSTARRTAQRAIRAIRGVRVGDPNFSALCLEQRSNVRHSFFPLQVSCSVLFFLLSRSTFRSVSVGRWVDVIVGYLALAVG